MSIQLAEQFMNALHRLEDDRDVDAIVALYGEQSEISNVVSHEAFHGSAGAREFWTKYRDAFGEVHSEFRNVIVSEKNVALEWVTSGTGADGAPFTYDGVSIIETSGQHVTRFRAFFDSASLSHQIVPATPSKGRGA
ncbi:MAG: nuclear transport factor 2 family protein [Herpetosiphon sp.]